MGGEIDGEMDRYCGSMLFCCQHFAIQEKNAKNTRAS